MVEASPGPAAVCPGWEEGHRQAEMPAETRETPGDFEGSQGWEITATISGYVSLQETS